MGAWRKAGVWLGVFEDDDESRYDDRRYNGARYNDRYDSQYAERDRPYDEVEDDELDGFEDDYEEPAPLPRVSRTERTTPRPVSRMPTASAGPATATHDNLALAPQLALRERAVVSDAVDESPYRITTLHPTTYNEARNIGEHFRNSIPVIMNLTEMDEADAKRLVDFAAGLAFGLRGSIERVTNRVFLLSPANVTVTAEDKARIAEGGFFNQS